MIRAATGGESGSESLRGPGGPARRFEATWRASGSGLRPEPADFLPPDPEARAAALVELLRVEMALRREAGEPAPVESFQARYPALDSDALVALIYEEFCLREEAGEAPTAAEYEDRFPVYAAAIREVLAIHSLFGPLATASTGAPGPPGVRFPETGETIAGFRLVEELGRGAFGRVFRAEERQLADRQVALKVTRTASREPQALARLQHTHIVPVHSYRTDPATGLHLLCMPFLGRLTLAQFLDDPRVRSARSGSELVAALDRLGPDLDVAGRPTARQELASRSFPRAIAWWGARLAEALQHAHERGVLHRDLKPSNVLVTADGMPMLLDFNLAQERWLDHPGVASAALGGTLAYMAPEHLESLTDPKAARPDARADLYALGVVLFEALAGGRRPYPNPRATPTIRRALLEAAEARRAGPARLRALRSEVPKALEAVLRRCLEPSPANRYANALELATDLRAVAEDAPLAFAHEPLPDRVGHWVRRHRRQLVVAVPLVAASAVVLATLSESRVARVRREAEIRSTIAEGRHALAQGRLDLAAAQFVTAARLTGDDPALGPLRAQARADQRYAQRTATVRAEADEIAAEAERLRVALLSSKVDFDAARRRVEEALALVATTGGSGSDLELLDLARRERLPGDVRDLLFLFLVTLDRLQPGDPSAARLALRICDRAPLPPDGPWSALRARFASSAVAAGPATRDAPERENSASTCFHWGLLRHLEGRTDAAIAWLERAARLRPDDFWSRLLLGFRHDRAGPEHREAALLHYGAAIALRKDSPWAYYNRARLLRERGDWEAALADLNRALELARDDDLIVRARLNRGEVLQLAGDAAGARAAYVSVLELAPSGPYRWAARLNRATLDLDSRALGRARAAYDALRAEAPVGPAERLGLALLALRLGRPAEAEADLNALLATAPEDPTSLLAHRARARLALGRPFEAVADTARVLRLRPTPAHQRLWVRAILAAGRDSELLGLDRPEAFERLPAAGPGLALDLRAAAERQRVPPGAPPEVALPGHRVRALLLSALNDPDALAEATRLVALAPMSPDGYLLRGTIRRRFGDRRAALADAEHGLALAPGSAELLGLRGLLLVETGRPETALRDLDRAILKDSAGPALAARARAWMALGRPLSAREDWSRILARDPEDPRAYLGRAQAWLRLGRTDRALVDLEQAAAWAGDDRGILVRTAMTYVVLLPAHPDRRARFLALVRRAWSRP